MAARFARYCLKFLSYYLASLGLDDLITPYIALFKRLSIDGRTLAALTEERLQRIGIKKELARRLILQACQLLVYYVRCHLNRAENIFTNLGSRSTNRKRAKTFNKSAR